MGYNMGYWELAGRVAARTDGALLTGPYPGDLSADKSCLLRLMMTACFTTQYTYQYKLFSYHPRGFTRALMEI